MKSILLAAAALASVGAIGIAAADEGFEALKGVDATPLAAVELDAVKGQHIHFVILDGDGNWRTIGASANAAPLLTIPGVGTLIHVNHQENNLGNGQALPISGPGYSGLCGAALNSPSLAIPGQGPSGTGGGC